MSTTIPPREPGRTALADLLRLVDGLRALAYDDSIDDADRARRVRDRFYEYDQVRARQEGTRP